MWERAPGNAMNANGTLQHFGAYRKALQLFDFVVADLRPLTTQPALSRLVSQQLASADSVASNIEEGFGRGTRKEYCQFLIISRGSAQETSGRYCRLRHWIPKETITARVALCGEIIGILTGTIDTPRRKS